MANWIKPKYSKSQIDKAGNIVRNSCSDQEEIEWAEEVLSNWRLIHGYPINTFNTTLRDKIRSIDKNALVAQRLKRRPSIVSKLQRETTRLSQMQDMGGLRAVVKDMTTLRKLVENYKSSKFKHEFLAQDDYISRPKDSGYRSIHLVYKYKNELAPEYNGLLIELQIRTKIQHAWATAVETMGTYLKHSLKSSEGPEEWLKFFVVTGAAFAHLEKQPPTPEYSEIPKLEIFKQVVEIEKKLEVIKKLKAFSTVITTTENIAGHYRLIILDAKANTVKITSYSKTKLGEANERYTEIEKNISDYSGIQAVLVTAKSIDLLKKAYPNYFLDTEEFIKQLEKIKAYTGHDL